MSKPALIHPDFAPQLAISLAIKSALCAGVFSKNAFYKIVGMTTLTGTIYSILNHTLASLDCIEFYAQYLQAYPGNKLEDRKIRSLNPHLNGFIH